MEKQQTDKGDRREGGELCILIRETRVVFLCTVVSRTVEAEGGDVEAAAPTELATREDRPGRTTGPLKDRRQDCVEEKDNRARVKICLFFMGFLLFIGVTLYLPLRFAWKDSPR